MLCSSYTSSLLELLFVPFALGAAEVVGATYTVVVVVVVVNLSVRAPVPQNESIIVLV